MYVYTSHVCSAHAGQKRAIGPLALKSCELQCGCWELIPGPLRAASVLQPLSHLSGLSLLPQEILKRKLLLTGLIAGLSVVGLVISVLWTRKSSLGPGMSSSSDKTVRDCGEVASISQSFALKEKFSDECSVPKGQFSFKLWSCLLSWPGVHCRELLEMG